MAFSLTEKLAVAGAFCALAVFAVGTDDNPGVVVAGQQTVEARGQGRALVRGDAAGSGVEQSWWRSSETASSRPRGRESRHSPAAIPRLPIEPGLESALPLTAEPGRPQG